MKVVSLEEMKSMPAGTVYCIENTYDWMVLLSSDKARHLIPRMDDNCHMCNQILAKKYPDKYDSNKMELVVKELETGFEAYEHMVENGLLNHLPNYWVMELEDISLVKQVNLML